jgi:hypothetical protein
MQEEYDALVSNGTWTLVPTPPGANIISGKWIFHHKFHSNGSLTRHKARWVVRGFTQQPGVDFDETFSPVVKHTTIRVVLSLAIYQNWPFHQLDVKNAFLHGHLHEEVYSQHPFGFLTLVFPLMFVVSKNLVMVLNKLLVHGFNGSLAMLIPLDLLSLNPTPLFLFFIMLP